MDCSGTIGSTPYFRYLHSQHRALYELEDAAGFSVAQGDSPSPELIDQLIGRPDLPQLVMDVLVSNAVHNFALVRRNVDFFAKIWDFLDEQTDEGEDFMPFQYLCASISVRMDGCFAFGM